MRTDLRILRVEELKLQEKDTAFPGSRARWERPKELLKALVQVLSVHDLVVAPLPESGGAKIRPAMRCG